MITSQKKKVLVSIVASLLVFNFFIGLIGFHAIDFTQDETNIERTILISLDSCNPEYLSRDWMPKMYNLLKQQGVIYKSAWAPVSAETMNGHTSMLTGCHPSSTGIVGNGFWNNDTRQNIVVVQDPQYRYVDTLFEDMANQGVLNSTGFVSGKWRLPRFLSNQSEFVFASPVTGIPLPAGYEARVGLPIWNIEGDMYDQWTMRALTELVRWDDPEFIFVNLAWLDDSGHDTGSFNFNHKRELLQLDDMLYQFIIDLIAMGKYKTTLFVFTGDHGMDPIYDFFNPDEYLTSNGISIDTIHWEGHSCYIYLKTPTSAIINQTVDLLNLNEKVAIALPYWELDQLHLNTTINRTGHVFVSCQENIVVAMGDLPIMYFGQHGGVSARDVPLAFMGPKIKEREFIQSIIPELVDIVPTLYSLWGVSIPAYMDGRVLTEIFK